MARVDRLPLRKRQPAAGRLGDRRDLPPRACCAGSSRTASSLADDLAELQDAEFLVPWDRAQGVEFAFKHPLIQEVTYDGLLEARREELHREVARAIETRLAEDAARLPRDARLPLQQGRATPSAPRSTCSARATRRRAPPASSEALALLPRGVGALLELHGDGGDPGKKAQLQKQHGARALQPRPARRGRGGTSTAPSSSSASGCRARRRRWRSALRPRSRRLAGASLRPGPRAPPGAPARCSAR